MKRMNVWALSALLVAAQAVTVFVVLMAVFLIGGDRALLYMPMLVPGLAAFGVARLVLGKWR